MTTRPAPWRLQPYVTYYVLESLPDGDPATGSVGDRKTGRMLFERVFWPLSKKPGGFVARMALPTNRKEFLGWLDQIRIEAEQGAQPCIHIEAHGNPTKEGKTDGIRLASGEVVTWKVLGNALRRINLACRCNLMVVVAACSSYHIVQIAPPTDRLPFLVALCSMRDVSAREVEECMVAFYETMLVTRKGLLSLTRTNDAGDPGKPDAFGMVTGDHLFKMTMDHYRKTYTTAIARQRWAERMLTRSANAPGYDQMNLTARRKLIKRLISAENHQPMVRKYFDQFFMLDLFPENVGLFENTWKASWPGNES